MLLAVSSIPPEVGPTREVFLFLHGILGSGGNWRGFAKRLLGGGWGREAGVEAWLVDLRMHGRSQGFAPPHTIEACVEDLADLVRSRGARVTSVLGHSFGGKVALAYAEAHPEGLERVMVIDSNPGIPLVKRGSETTMQVLDLLGAAPREFATREAFTTHFVGRGLDAGVTAWLAMNLAASGDVFVFKLDLSAIRAMLEDYLARDLFPFVEAPPPAYRGVTVFVKGERSPTIDAEAEARLVAAAVRSEECGPRVVLESIPNAGHWVHVDAPDALQNALAKHLGSSS